MNLTLLETIACPASIGGSRCLGQLVPSERPAPRFDDQSPRELIEGLLECQQCGQRYPVLCGVAILLPDSSTYLGQHYQSILALALEHDLGLGAEMRTYLHGLGAHAYPGPRATGEDSPSALSSYLRAHYDSGAVPFESLPAGHALEAFSRSYRQNDLYNVLVNMITPHLPADAKILDIGCHVGRLSRDLAGLGHRVIGVDTSFAAVFTARRALRGWPAPLESYEYSPDGVQRESRQLDLSPRPNADCLVASATQLPFKPGSFQAAACANVIDILPDPIALLRDIRAVLEDGGILGLSTPYHRGAGRAVSRWLGPEKRMGAAQALKWRLSHFFEILAEQDMVPWVLGDHERRFQVYLNHCLVARKNPKTDSQ